MKQVRLKPVIHKKLVEIKERWIERDKKLNGRVWKNYEVVAWLINNEHKKGGK